MEIIAQIIGLFAVGTFLLSYQQKKRSSIIFCNTVSRCLYILQYVLLGAFSGAVLDVFGAISSVVAGRKNKGFVAQHTKAVMLCINALMVAAGLFISFINKRWIDLLPLAGVLLHTSAFWISDEKIIRRVSLLGSPFWLVYNFMSRAYGSALGDILTMCSIVLAMIRYRNSEGKKAEEKTGKCQ